MKKSILIFAVVLFVACSNKRDVSELRLNSDKTEEVKEKFGQADSIAKAAFLGMSSELWVYKQDSISLIFVNDILTEIHTAETQREMKRKIEADAQRLADSLLEEVNREYEQSKN
ncbi:MAG: hypothetical protein L6Q66_12930 [Bacteroidia bacterium]|nr:hypothetical protein [Bacteroidia bacterium]